MCEVMLRGAEDSVKIMRYCWDILRMAWEMAEKG